MDVEQIKRRADEHKIIYEVAVKIRELVNDAVQQIGDTADSGEDVEVLIGKLVFD